LSPGIWFCTSCTNKRFQFGIHSIVDGIESVWDVKDAEGKYNLSSDMRQNLLYQFFCFQIYYFYLSDLCL
jgi:hypothetical protein